VLGAKAWELTQVAAETAGVAPWEKSYHKKFEIPTLLAGPCQIVGYVIGTNAPTFVGNIKFAHIPASWVATS
jgi:hypothetical protein